MRDHVTMPHDPRAEDSVLGSCLADDDAPDSVLSVLRPSDMYQRDAELVLEAIASLRSADKPQPIDAVTVGSWLRAKEQWNAIDHDWFASITERCVPSHLERHCAIVKELAARRRTIRVAEKIAADGYANTTATKGYLENANTLIAHATDCTDDNEPVSMEQAVQEAFARIEKATNEGKRTTGIETGFRDLDTLLTGLHPGQLIIVAARPAMGKTSLVTNMCATIAEREEGEVLFFSLEMPRIELANRMLCAEARVDQSRLRSNMLSQDDMTAMTAAASKVFAMPIFIDDTGEVTLQRVRAKSRKRKKLKLIVIDYLQLMRGSDHAESREREISEISRGLKALAKELEVPIIALSQLNRSPETRSSKDKRPQLSDLRESGAIEQDADVVMFIYRDEVYNKHTEDKGIAELIVAKQRNGPTDTVRLRFVRELTKFENLFEDSEGASPYYGNRDVAPAYIPPGYDMRAANAFAGSDGVDDAAE